MKKKTNLHPVKSVKKVLKHGQYFCKTYVRIIFVICILAIAFIATAKMTASSQVLGVSTETSQGPCSGHAFCK